MGETERSRAGPMEAGERIAALESAEVLRNPPWGGGAWEFPGEMPKVRWVFEAGLPDPATFPIDDLAAYTDAVLRHDAADGLQYGGVASNSILYGYEGLRDLIAERTLRREGRAVDRRSVMLTLGGVQAISLATRAFLDEGDTIAVEAPTWGAALGAARNAGADAVAIPMDGEGMIVDELERAIGRLGADGRSLKLVYTIATFNTPTGWSLSRARREQLLRFAEQHGFLVLEDNVYGELRYDGDELPTLFSLDRSGLVVKIDSFSKILAPALRIGWVTGDPEAIRALGVVRGDLGVSQWIARVVARFMSEGRLEPHIASVNALYRDKRDAAVAALREHCGPWVHFDVPDGGFFIWVGLAPEVDGQQAMMKALAEGVVCRPGERFFGDTDADIAKQWFRLNFTMIDIAEIDRGIAALGAAIAASVR